MKEMTVGWEATCTGDPDTLQGVLSEDVTCFKLQVRQKVLLHTGAAFPPGIPDTPK